MFWLYLGHCHDGFCLYFVEREKTHFVYVQRTVKEEERFSQASAEKGFEGSQEISTFGKSSKVALCFGLRLFS